MYKGEFFNSISHIVGAVAALVGLVIVVVAAVQQGDPWKIVSFSIYGTTLFLLYTFSALYHSLQGRSKLIFRKLDHLSIYFLIAGTYTPFALVTLRGAWGWTIFGIIWGLVIVGVVLELLPKTGNRTWSVVVYILMGWLIIIALKPLLKALPAGGFIGLLFGGIFYTGGLVFYSLGGRVKHFHGIWHLCVLTGSVSHYLTILFYVA